MPNAPKESRRVTKEWAESLGWTEGEHFYVNHSGTVISLIENESRACEICSRPRRATQFYSALHKGCRACMRRARDGVSIDSPLIKAREIDMAENPNSVETPKEARNRVQAHDKELAARVLSRRRLIKFIERFHPGYMAGWIHKDICRRLERFADRIALGLSPRLLLFCPPRLGKSLISSQYFPAWLLGHHPEFEIIAASYNITLPIGFSRRIRELVRDPSYTSMFAKTKLSDESQAVESWRTTAGGGYTAAGVGTGITGKGCHCIPLTQLVMTPTGPESLANLIKSGKDLIRVLSFDGANIVEGEVNAILTRTSDHYYVVETESGSFEATGEHPVCVGVQDGRPIYRRVDDLGAGESVVTIRREARLPAASSDEVFGVRSGVVEERVETTLGAPSLHRAYPHLFERLRGRVADGKRGCAASLRRMRSAVYALGQRACEAFSARRLRAFLLQRVLWKAPLQNLRGGGASLVHAGGAVLLAMWSAIQPQKEPRERSQNRDAFLQPGVLRGFANWEAYPEGYASRWGAILPSRVSTAARSAGRAEPTVCRVWVAGKRPAPSGWEQGEHLVREPGAGVSQLPQQPQQPSSLTYSRIKRISRIDGPVEVGDLEVAGHHNFMLSNGYLTLNCLIVDDPIKDWEAADSAAIREGTWEWYLSTAYTRIAPGGGVLGIQTRWNDDDWAGRIVLAMDSGDGEQFEVVSYPAINETGDEYLLADDSIAQIAPGLDVPDGAQLLRVQNSALHPERYSLEHLQRIQKNFKASGNTRMWSALYQQNPVPEEGAFFRKDMMKYISYVPETRGMHVYQAWDFAITEKKQNDWIVGYCIMQDEKDNIYELDMVRFKSDDTVIISDAILDFQQKWNAWLVGFEDGQIWKATKAILLRRCSERGVALNFETLTPLTDKLVRAGPLRGRMQMGKMYFQQEASYGRERDNELLRFPAGKHDDIVDAAAWAMRLTLAHAPPRKPEPKKIKGWRDKLAAGTSGASHMAA